MRPREIAETNLVGFVVLIWVYLQRIVSILLPATGRAHIDVDTHLLVTVGAHGDNVVPAVGKKEVAEECY